MNNLAFTPTFLFPDEYTDYGIGSAALEADIDNLVGLASSLIDDYCGRVDGDGQGSLVYTTYQERLTCQSLDRNIFYIPHRPLVAISQQTIDDLISRDGESSARYYTGCLPSIHTLADGRMSAIIGASGRFSYGRRGPQSQNFMSNFMTPVMTGVEFGSPNSWQPIDMVNLDYDTKTNELWLGLNVSLYNNYYDEIIVTYNSGFDPRNLPRKLKLATAAVVKNLLSKGSGTTGMTSFSLSRSGESAQFKEEAIDANVDLLLRSFITVRV